MQRRKFIAAMGSLAAGGAAATGTGAFTSVSANRTVDVSVADDSSALLGLATDPNNDGTDEAANADYVDTSGSQVTITLDSAASGNNTGSGVNADATTQINDLFRVVNQGTQAAVVYVPPSSIAEANRTDGGSGIMIDPQATSRPNGDFSKTGGSSAEDDQISLTGVYDGPKTQYADRGSASPASGEDDSLEEFVLEPGESFEFGLWVETDDSVNSSSSIDATLEIVADTTMVPDTYYGDDN